MLVAFCEQTSKTPEKIYLLWACACLFCFLRFDNFKSPGIKNNKTDEATAQHKSVISTLRVNAVIPKKSGIIRLSASIRTNEIARQAPLIFVSGKQRRKRLRYPIV